MAWSNFLLISESLCCFCWFSPLFGAGFFIYCKDFFFSWVLHFLPFAVWVVLIFSSFQNYCVACVHFFLCLVVVKLLFFGFFLFFPPNLLLMDDYCSNDLLLLHNPCGIMYTAVVVVVWFEFKGLGTHLINESILWNNLIYCSIHPLQMLNPYQPKTKTLQN